MKQFIGLLWILLILSNRAHSQPPRPDTVFFNLYTDSLKPGTRNYINVVAGIGNNFLPLTSEELIFKADTGRFMGNDWFIEEGFEGDSIRVTVTHRFYPEIQISRIVNIKKGPSSAIRVKTMEEVMDKPRQKKN
jgi:hypothetical protein